MHVRALPTDGTQGWIVVLASGEEAMAALERFAAAQGIGAAQIQGIGACRRAILAYWNPATRAYEEHPVDEQAEVVGLHGNISRLGDGRPRVHLHAVLSLADGSCRGGHLLQLEAHPTLEVFLTTFATSLPRVDDPAVGLALLRP